MKQFKGLRWWLLAATMLVLIALQAALLVWLPNTTSQLQAISAEDAARAPAATFTLGPVSWDLSAYEEDKNLSDFRDYFQAHCAGTDGLIAAKCVSNALASDIHFGNTAADFLRNTYDPRADFQAELNGAPGYCTNFSTFLAAALLSEKIPARVVQFLPATLNGVGGHTIVEVWDAAQGWVLIDPSYGAEIKCDGRNCSALDLMQHLDSLTWSPLTQPARSPGAAAIYDARPLLFNGAKIAYPEPWFYLRTGPRFATVPFLAAFVLVGQLSFQYGIAQNILHIGIIICGGLAIVSIALALRSIVRRSVSRS